MTALTREQLLAPIAIKRERIEVPELGEDAYVWVHGMTAREKNDWDAWVMRPKWDGVRPDRAKQQKERMIIACVRDDSGAGIFTRDDIEAILQWPADLSNRLFDAANRLSGGQSDSKKSDTTDDD